MGVKSYSDLLHIFRCHDPHHPGCTPLFVCEFIGGITGHQVKLGPATSAEPPVALFLVHCREVNGQR